MRPTVLHVGGTLCWELPTFDPDSPGVLKDADSTPTITIRKNGAATSDSVTVTKRAASTGLYDCTYNPASEIETDSFQIRETMVITGSTTTQKTYHNVFHVTVLGTATLYSELLSQEISSGNWDWPIAIEVINAAVLAAINTYVDGALATVNGTVATIVGFPSSLVTGDSYTSDGGNSITVFIRDSNDDPITSVGTHEFTDPDFECDLVITSSGNAGRVRATVTYVDPGPGESYLRVEIPLSESRRAAPGTATMQCVLKWDGCQKTIATQTVTWVPRI